jgi:exopolysaccharide production protein ExoQ
MRGVPSARTTWLSAIHLAYGILLPLAGLLLPLFLIPLAVGGGVIGAAVVWRQEGRFPWPAPALTALALATLAWTALSILWTFQPADGFGRWLNLPLLLLAALLLLGAGRRYPAALAATLLRGLLLGFSLGALVIVVEWLAGSPLIELTRGAQPTPARALGELNRGLALAALLVWAPVAWLAGRGRRAAWLLPLLILPPALALQNLASVVALLGGLALALVTWLRPGLGRALVLLLPALLLLLGPPLFIQLYGWGLADSASLPSTARYRVQIWWFVSERIYEKPVWGWGFDAARRMPDFGVEPYGGKARVIPTHPHQAFLQAWLELGLPGLLLAFGWFALAWRGLARLSGPTLAAGVALAGAVIAVAATAFGLWQGHTLAILVLSVAIFQVALRALGVGAADQVRHALQPAGQAHGEVRPGQG